MSFNIIVKNYQHFNRAMNKQINSKAHYEKEMVKGGYIPQEQADRIADQRKAEMQKKYDGLSKSAMEVCKAAYQMGDRKTGKLKATDSLIDAMKKEGVSFDKCDNLPEGKGGFNE